MADLNIPALVPWRKNSPFTREEWADIQKPLAGESAEERSSRLDRARHAKRKERDPSYRVAQNKAWREANAESERERLRAWAAHNPDRVKANQKAYYDRNAPKRLENYRQWAAANRERRRSYMHAWFAANPGMNAFYSSKWRQAAFRATPPWADLNAIRAIYEECARVSEASGVPHDVDHEIPLSHPLVCGLHVQGNLRVVPASVNRKKHNKFNPADFDWPQPEK